MDCNRGQRLPESSRRTQCRMNAREAAPTSATLITNHFAMTLDEHELDAHARPPERLKGFYKKYQKLKGNDLENDQTLLDLEQIDAGRGLRVIKEINYKHLSETTSGKVSNNGGLVDQFLASCEDLVRVYEHPDMPGMNTNTISMIEHSS
jgi:hypothetical protein